MNITEAIEKWHMAYVSELECDESRSESYGELELVLFAFETLIDKNLGE